jgi:hypothetical protein
MLAVPTMTNRITIQIAGLLDSLRQAAMDSEHAIDLKFCISHGHSPVEYARNLLCGAFLRTECDKLWFIDEDMLPEPTVVRLLYSDADIISARMYKFDHPNPEKGKTVGLGLCAMMKQKNGLYGPLLPSIGDPCVQDVDAVGTACTVINRKVIEDRRLWSDNVYTKADGVTEDGNVDIGGDYAPAVFRFPRAANGMGIMGEDIDFCERAKALGYTVKVDLNAACGHFKSIDIDQTGYLAQETLRRAIEGIHLEDGSVVSTDLKSVLKPHLDKMVRSEMAVVK